MTTAGAKRVIAALVGMLLTVIMAAQPAPAQPADFYKGRTIDLTIGYSVGGGYDTTARVLARHMSKHIPGNPTIVPKNMEGAGSLRLANWLYNVAPKDGTAFGTIGRGTAFDPLLGNKAAQFDATKLSYIGSAANEVSLCVALQGQGVSTFEDLRAKPLIVGGTSASADSDQFPKILNGVLGTRMRVVTGYPGGSEIALAMERGELQGRCGWALSSIRNSHKDWLDKKRIAILVQLAITRHPDLPDVPLVTELARTEEERQILRLIFARQVMGRPFLAPPGVPAERLEILRRAFMATMNDPAFLADAEKTQLEIAPIDGAALEALVKEIYATPPEVAKRAIAILR